MRQPLCLGRRSLTVAIALVAFTAAGCDSESADDDNLNPDGESIIDQDIDDETVITDPAGLSNQLDGNDGDIEDDTAVVDD